MLGPCDRVAAGPPGPGRRGPRVGQGQRLQRLRCLGPRPGLQVTCVLTDMI